MLKSLQREMISLKRALKPLRLGVGYQVYINIVSGSSVSQTKLTTNTNMVIYFYPGNVWYESDTGVFFYTFSEATSEPIHIIYLGGIYVDGTPYWNTPLTMPTIPGNSIAYLKGGVTISASDIYII